MMIMSIGLQLSSFRTLGCLLLLSASRLDQSLTMSITSSLFAQDLELASGMALGIRSPIPLGAVATQLYRIVQSRGYGEKDFSFVYQLLKEEQGKKE